MSSHFQRMVVEPRNGARVTTEPPLNFNSRWDITKGSAAHVEPPSFGVAFVLGILVGSVFIPTAFAQFRTVKTQRLVTADLTGWCGGKEVTVELNQAGPGTSGRRYHPAHSFTYVLEGSETYTLEGQAAKTVKPGDMLHEAPMQVHTVDNLSSVKLLVVRVIDKGKEATVRVP